MSEVIYLEKEVDLDDLPLLPESAKEAVGECVESLVLSMLVSVGLTISDLDTYKWQGKVHVSVRTTVPRPDGK